MKIAPKVDTMAEGAQELKSLKSSLRTNKGHLTRLINMAGRLCEISETDHSETTATSLKDQIEELDHRIKVIIDGYTSIAELDPDKEEETATAMETESKRYEDCKIALIKALSAINRPPAQPASTAPVTNNQSTHVKANEALRPFMLTTETNPVEFRSWQRKFKAYYSASGFENSPLAQQHAYLQNCLDPKLEQRVQDSVTDQTPVFGENSYISAIEEDLLLRFPMFTRRLDFFKFTQAKGQSFSDFSAALRAKGDEADLARLTPDDHYVYRYICGTTDEALKTRFLRIENPKKSDIENEARAYERASSTLKAMSGDVNTVRGPPKKPWNKGRGFQKPQQNAQEPSQGDEKCFKCGEKGHTKPTCKKPWRNLKCTYCKSLGHVESVCIKKNYAQNKGQQQQAHAVTANSGNVGMINVAHQTAGEPNQRMEVTIKASSGTPFTFAAIPDTGCTTRTVISYDLTQKHKLPIDPSQKEPLAAANRQSMECEGSVQAEFTFMGRKVLINALVSSSMVNEILVSRQDLKQFGVIPEDFPSIINAIKAQPIRDARATEATDRFHTDIDIFIKKTDL